MKHCVLIFSILLGLYRSSLAQIPDLAWAKNAGGTGSYSLGNSTATDINGNVYTIGYFYGTVDFDPGPGVEELTSVGNGEAFILKLDVSGDFVWVQHMGTWGISLTTDIDGNIYATGYLDIDGNFGTIPITTNGSYDGFICKLDTDGNFIWAENIGGSGTDFANSIAVVPTADNHDVYVTGVFQSTVDFEPGAGVTSLSSVGGSDDVFVLKLDENGNFLWVSSMGGTGSETSNSIYVHMGKVFLTGYFDDTNPNDADFDPTGGTAYLVSNGNDDIFICSLTEDGDFEWAKQIGGSGWDYGNSITTDAGGNVYTTGSFYYPDPVDFDPGPGVFELTAMGNPEDIFILKLDPAGDFVWAKSMSGQDGDSNGVGNSITVNFSGDVYVAGRFYGTMDFDPDAVETYFLTSDPGPIFISKYTSAGDLVWASAYGGFSNDAANSIRSDIAGNIYVTGSFQGSGVDFAPGNCVSNLDAIGSPDIFIQKFGTTFDDCSTTPPEFELTISNNHLKEFPITSGYITSIVAGDTYAVLRGNFSGIGPYQGSGAVVGAITGVHDTAYPIIHSGAGDVVADGSGGWYVVGNSDINDFNYGSLLHIRSDKTIDANWLPQSNSPVTNLALEGNTLYVAGTFTQIAGESRNRFAAFDVTTGAILPWDPGVSGNTINFLNKLTASGGMVYVGGQFTSIGGVARKNLAAINGTTGAVTAWNPTVDGINSSTSDIVVSGSLVYVSGFFTSAGGASRKSLAALDITTGLATSWNPNPTGIGFGGGSVVEAMLIDGSTMYIGGTFTAVGGTSREYLAAINITTGVLTGWDPNFDDSRVYTLALLGTTLYVGGTFNTVNGLDMEYLVAVSTVDGSLTSWNPDPKTFVLRMALSGSNLFVSGGGNFQFDWPTANSFAVINNSTAEVYLTDLDLGGGSITCAIAIGNTLYTSGTFTQVNGQARQGLAAIDIPSNTLLSWAPSTDGQVNAITGNGTSIFIGGNFSTVNGSTRDGLAALDASTGSSLEWNASIDIDGEVMALYSADGKLYMGGDFTSVNSTARNRVASFDLITGSLLSWNPTTGNFQDIVKIEANTDWVIVKNFSDLAITALSAITGSVVSEFSPVLGLDPDFALAYNQVILGPELAAYDLYEDDFTSWTPDVGLTSDGDPAVGAVAFVTDKILVGGEFSQMGFESRENFGAYSVSIQSGAITINTQPIDVIACEGETVSFTVDASGTPNLTYQWQFSPDGIVAFADLNDDTNYSNVTTATLTINTTSNFGSGQYRCKIDGDLALTVFSDNVDLLVNSIPSPPVAGNQSNCTPASLTLNATGGTNGQYRWYSQMTGGINIAGEVNSNYTTPLLSATTTYYVSTVNGTCESSRVPLTVTIGGIACANKPPVIRATFTSTTIAGIVTIDLTTLISDPDDNVDFTTLKIISFPASGAAAEINNNILTIDYSGLAFAGEDKLTIEVCDLLGSCSQQELIINVADDIFVYNGISPNGDLFNEKWVIQNIESLPDTKENKVSIFNRWGDLVFETINYDNDTSVFKGLNKNGNEVGSGIYFYKIEFVSGRKAITGYLTLKR